jgi:hypothetical protein
MMVTVPLTVTLIKFGGVNPLGQSAAEFGI